MPLNSPFFDFRGEHRAEPIPPESHAFVTDIDTALGQDILYLPKRLWIADIHHHREADDFG